MKTIVGDLKTISLYNIVEAVEVQGKTGRLGVARAGIAKTFFFEDGEMVFVTSTRPGERLGEFLSATGCLDLARMESLLAESRRRGERLTADLLAAKVFERKELERSLCQLVVRALADALSWEDGSFELHPDLPPGILSGPVTIRVPQALGQAQRLKARASGQEIL